MYSGLISIPRPVRQSQYKSFSPLPHCTRIATDCGRKQHHTGSRNLSKHGRLVDQRAFHMQFVVAQRNLQPRIPRLGMMIHLSESSLDYAIRSLPSHLSRFANTSDSLPELDLVPKNTTTDGEESPRQKLCQTRLPLATATRSEMDDTIGIDRGGIRTHGSCVTESWSPTSIRSDSKTLCEAVCSQVLMEESRTPKCSAPVCSGSANLVLHRMWQLVDQKIRGTISHAFLSTPEFQHVQPAWVVGRDLRKDRHNHCSGLKLEAGLVDGEELKFSSKRFDTDTSRWSVCRVSSRKYDACRSLMQASGMLWLAKQAKHRRHQLPSSDVILFQSCRSRTDCNRTFVRLEKFDVSQPRQNLFRTGF